MKFFKFFVFVQCLLQSIQFTPQQHRYVHVHVHVQAQAHDHTNEIGNEHKIYTKYRHIHPHPHPHPHIHMYIHSMIQIYTITSILTSIDTCHQITTLTFRIVCPEPEQEQEPDRNFILKQSNVQTKFNNEIENKTIE
jgi:hypothetical protein